jgi:hypothetical protein
MTRGRMGWLPMSMLAGSVGLGCAHREGLVPAPQATVIPGQPTVAYDQRSGVEVLINGDAWRSNPRDLDKVMTPVRVTIQNRSDTPIRVSYKAFALETPANVRMNPLPPFSMRTAGPARTAIVADPAFDYDRFYLPSFYAPYYPTMRTWASAFPYDPGFYDRGFVEWRVELPTEDMLRMALPEGVIDPGGSLSGFLYFPDVPPKERGVFTLHADFPKEQGGHSLASVQIPLVTK